MNRSLGKALAVLCGLALSAFSAVIARAQMSEVKEKPPMYTYVNFRNIPRAQWADMDKSIASVQKPPENQRSKIQCTTVLDPNFFWAALYRGIPRAKKFETSHCYLENVS